VQKRGAKIHFNEVYLPKDYDPESDHDNSLQIPFRYGIIKLDDLKRDLKYWETLLVSSMMQRPFETVIEPREDA